MDAGFRRKGFQMSQQIRLSINGREIEVREGTSVAAALMMAGESCRVSVHGEPRAPLCGMGICMECRATVNGVPHQRTCQMICAPVMKVVTK